jgi:hypothetical protein
MTSFSFGLFKYEKEVTLSPRDSKIAFYQKNERRVSEDGNNTFGLQTATPSLLRPG